MKYFKKIEGERIYLSPINVEDVEMYTKWMNDFLVTDGIGSSHLVSTLIGEKEWIENSGKSGNLVFAIVDKETDTLLGNCDFHNVDYLKQIAEIGIFIGEEENRNKGVGTEVIKLLIKYGFDYLNFNNIGLKVYSFNERAIKAYEKCGFKEYGRRHQVMPMHNKLYDDIYMEILRCDYYKDK